MISWLVHLIFANGEIRFSFGREMRMFAFKRDQLAFHQDEIGQPSQLLIEWSLFESWNGYRV